MYKESNKLTSRISYISQLLFIKNKVKFSFFDVIILASYEPVSLFFANITDPMLIINHNTISGLDNSKIKEFFTQRISKRNTHVVFDDDMRQRLIQLRITKIEIIPHGYNKPFAIKDYNVHLDLFSEKDIKKFAKSFIVFIPSSGSVDNNFVSQILQNKKFNEFLIDKNILFFIKGKYTINKDLNKNIILIERRLTDFEYKCLFTISAVILLPYGNNFKYRTSGVLFECFSNNKPCLLSKIKSMLYYSKYFEYNPFFETISDLESRILHISHNQKNGGFTYKCLDELNPTNNWSKILYKLNI
jgi:hypothetical protein